MNTEAMEPYGQALLDFFNGDVLAKVAVHRDDGFTDDLVPSGFFRKPSGFSPLEQTAMMLCRGYTLDIGAGTGCHSLALQDRGIRVLAIDISPHAIEIMSKRGVKESQKIDVFEFHEGHFDTLLMMHGIGMVEDLSGLERFLCHAHQLLKPDGQIVFDSLDVSYTDDPRYLAYQEANRRAGRYFGEIRRRFEYKGQMGPFFGWLHVDLETLINHAERIGWSCQVVYRGEGGDYLAQLTSMGRGVS
ncbi:MAG: methyltransferase domain-containing protein [Anaerolineales bacterium]|nr:methyltransferase domain-containing protein [Anaerolineales bacterium]